MNLKFGILTIAICGILAGCTKKQEPVKGPPNYFSKMYGCFLLYNVKTKVFEKTIGEERCKERFPACSTFKVPLAVMAFDSKMLPDENTVVRWDGTVYDRAELNRDQNAKTWMRDSVVWFSQRLTEKMREKKLQKYLNDFNYGNKDLSGGITQAWLTSPSARMGALTISAYEQVDFMKKLWTDSLPATKRAMQLTKDITFLENSPKGYQLNGKTGSNYYDPAKTVRLGWFIAHVQGHNQEYIAVTNFSDEASTTDKTAGGLKAKDITKAILKDQGLW